MSGGRFVWSSGLCLRVGGTREVLTIVGPVREMILGI